MLDRMTTQYPRVVIHYYGKGPWHEIGYEDFLTRVRWMKLDPAEESTRLLNGEEVRLGNSAFRLFSPEEQELQPTPAVEENQEIIKTDTQISLF